MANHCQSLKTELYQLHSPPACGKVVCPQPTSHEAERATMSIPQAIPGVQAVPGPSARRNNGIQPFVQPVPHILTTDSQTAWSGEPQLRIASWTSTTVQVGGIWLFQETVQRFRQVPWSKSPLDIARDAATHRTFALTQTRPSGSGHQLVPVLSDDCCAHDLPHRLLAAGEEGRENK